MGTQYRDNDQSPGPDPNHAVDPEIIALFSRYEHIRQTDPKDALITELIIRLEAASRPTGSTHYQETIKQLQRENKQLKATMAKDPFVLLLVDGDGMIFHEELLRQGEVGGKRAASLLQTNALLHLQDAIQDLPHDIKIVCRIYANVKGLADALCRANIIESPAFFEAFVSGFTRSFTLFDFVDVGPGKDRADEKIQETFKLHLRSSQCRRILLGVSHDNGFARMLEEPILDEGLFRKIILVQGVPFEKELLAFALPSVQFGNLFRDTKLMVPVQPLSSRPDTPQSTEYQSNGSLTRSTTSSSLQEAAMIATGKTVVSSTPMTWAGLAAAPAPAPVPIAHHLKSPVSAPATPSSEAMVNLGDSSTKIPRNRKGQRVDPPYRDYDKSEVERIKKMKLCNSHYLLARCYRETCGHRHDYKPNGTELDVLRLVARMAPCTAGSACDDSTCIYGHRCPFPKRGDGRKASKSPEEKTCMLGPQCRFGTDVHDIDMNVVKVTKIR